MSKFFIIFFGIFAIELQAQNNGGRNDTADPSVKPGNTNNQPGLLIPQKTTAERNELKNPTPGMLIYNPDCNVIEYFDGKQWIVVHYLQTGKGNIGMFSALPPTNVSSAQFTANWSLTGANTYFLDVATDPNFNNFLPGYFNLNVGNTNSHLVKLTAGGCNANGSFYYRVKAQNACGSAQVSNIQSVGSCPCTNQWQQLTSPPPSFRVCQDHITAAVGNKIYVGLGHNHSNNAMTDQLWEYDVDACIWTQKASSPVKLSKSAHFVINGVIYMVGGWKNDAVSSYTNEVWAYNTATNTWSGPLGTGLPNPVIGPAGCSDGSFGYVFGGTKGHNKDSQAYNEIYRFDPRTNTFTLLTTYPGGGRRSPFMAYFNNKLYVGTGMALGGAYSSKFHAFDLSSNTWTELAPHPQQIWQGQATVHPSGKIYVIGNHIQGAENLASKFHYYDIASNTWVAMPKFPPGGRNDIMGGWVNGTWYGGLGHSGSPNYAKDWWKFCP